MDIQFRVVEGCVGEVGFQAQYDNNDQPQTCNLYKCYQKSQNLLTGIKSEA